MHKERIELTDTLMTATIKLAEGNPGALTTLVKLIESAPSIDPQSIFGPLAPLIALDIHGIYGSDIYILFNDKCDRDARKTILLLRAVQLGIMPERKLQKLAADQTRSVNITEDEWNSIDHKVCVQLTEFCTPQLWEEQTNAPPTNLA